MPTWRDALACVSDHDIAVVICERDLPDGGWQLVRPNLTVCRSGPPDFHIEAGGRCTRAEVLNLGATTSWTSRLIRTRSAASCSSLGTSGEDARTALPELRLLSMEVSTLRISERIQSGRYQRDAVAQNRTKAMRAHETLVVAVVAVLFVVLTGGCRKRIAAAPPASVPVQKEAAAPPPAPTASLAADPGTIERGQPAILKWSSTDATEVVIFGLGVVAASGAKEVYPVDSTTYTLTAAGPGGSRSATVGISVTLPTPPAIPPPARSKTLRERMETEVADVYFDFEKSYIREDARATLVKDSAALRSILAEFPDATVIVEGHCEERESAEPNLRLGDRRATSTNVLLELLGVSTNRLKMISYGREKPQCADSTEDCRQRNRRVHFAADEN